MDFSSVVTYLSAISSIAVILGAIFVIFQLRQNSKLIELQVRQNRSSIALALLDKITDESFASRRMKMYESIKKAVATNWEGFDGSLEDHESRNFGYIYELIGQLARAGVVDLQLLRSTLQYLVVWDWEAFSPLSKHFMERFKVSVHPWENFEWLAEGNRKYMAEKEEERRKSKEKGKTTG
jgi:hypothetical protein